MIWDKQKVANFIKNNDKNIKAVLIHSDNEGYVNETEREIASSVANLNDAFLVDELDGENLKETDFMTAINTLALTMQRRVVRINGTGKSLPDLIRKMVAEYAGDTLVIIRADYLKKGLALRTLFQTSPVLAEIVHYGDSEQEIKALVIAMVKKYNKNIDNDAVNYISKNNGLDFLIVKSEMEKLITYAWEKETINLSDAMAVIDDNTGVSVDDIIYGTLNGDFEKITKALSRFFLEENNPSSVAIMVTRLFFSHIDKMREGQSRMNEGQDIDKAVAGIKPQIHFSVAPMFKKHLMIWNASKLDEVTKILFELEKSCKITKMPIEILSERALFKIASIKTNS